MNFPFHPEASIEFREAAQYYNACKPGLGNRFTEIVETTVQAIVKNPLRWRIVEDDVHCAATRTFPYLIFYTVEKDYILVLAVAHAKRKPGYWRNRLKPD